MPKIQIGRPKHDEIAIINGSLDKYMQRLGMNVHAELTIIQGNIVINVINGIKTRTFMFPGKYVPLEDIQTKFEELNSMGWAR